MSRFIKALISFAVIFVILIIALNCGCSIMAERQGSERNITANRINDEITREYKSSGMDIERIISARKAEWNEKYGKRAPEKIVYIPVQRKNNDAFYVTADNLCAVCSIYDARGEAVGFVEYIYKEEHHPEFILAANVFILICFIITLSAFIYLTITVLMPFRRLSEYPEKLARMRDIQKLPESKSRYFGKYIWGMNMLTDVLASNSKRIHSLECQRQTLVSTIAHGVKTPVANIRLYTDAVRTGLYSDNGMTVEIADNIDRNTEKIEALTAELIKSANSLTDERDIEITSFNISELAELIRSEYNDRMKLKRINFTVECRSQSVIDSDKYALYRAVSQLLENAMKYGDGRGVAVELIRDDESICISVKNRGELLPEKELPYVFRSYWRGSNAADKEGSGIGLYVVHETARALGGSVCVRRLEETSEMEFVICIDMA
jgi:signal transduction histidine kinase